MIDSKNFTGPDPTEWRFGASVAYFKDKLYYLGGRDDKDKDDEDISDEDPRTWEDTNRVDVRRSNESP